MARRLAFAVVALVLSTNHAQAQWVVIDPANLEQTILIATRTAQHYQQLVREFLIIQRMARGLATLDRYQVPAIALSAINPAQWTYGRPWLRAMTGGDATGRLYLQSALPLEPPAARLAQLTTAARQAFERRLATVEVTDAVAMMGGHQVALIRGYHGELQQAVQALQGDVLSTATGYHEMTAVLDKVAAGELLARRQDMAANQLLSHVLEQLLAKSKRLRDTEAATLNMQLITWRDGQAANDAFAAGAGDALRTWRPR